MDWFRNSNDCLDWVEYFFTHMIDDERIKIREGEE